MKAKSIRTAMAAALAVAAIAESCVVAGEANQAAGRMDAPVAGARVGFALTMEPQTYRLDFGGGKTISGTLAAREWRLVNLAHAYWDLDSYAVNDNVDIDFGSKIPLWLFGFMY